MYNFTYENQGTNTFLVYKVEPTDILDNMSLGMLTNNKIPGLSSTLFTQMNDDKYIKYNISSQISARQLFYGSVNRKRLLTVFKGIADTMIALDDYMIDVNLVLLDLDYIFVDASSFEVNMICLPVSNGEGAVSLYDFIKSIMFSTQFEQSENCNYVTMIINFLNSTPNFSLNSFKQFIDGLSESTPAPAPAASAPTVNNVSPQANIPRTPVNNVPPAVNNASPAAPAAPMGMNNTNNVNNINHANNMNYMNAPATPAAKPYTPPAAPAAPKPPVVPPTPAAPAQPAKAQEPQGKKMSFFYLMQHYNSENVAAYKAQKEAKKTGNTAAPTPAKPAPAQPSGNFGNMGFAIPGQETPVAPPTPAAPVNPTPPPVQQVKPQVQQRPATPVNPAPAPKPQPQPQPQPAPIFAPQVPVFGDFDDDEGTVVIGAMQQERQLSPHLIRRKTGERIEINKPVFKIGRNSEINDYNIMENKFIGHCHCHIVARDSDFYIVDDNSRNHTYVDGRMITGSVEISIQDGCVIRLADEDFEFKLY